MADSRAVFRRRLMITFWCEIARLHRRGCHLGRRSAPSQFGFPRAISGRRSEIPKL